MLRLCFLLCGLLVSTWLMGQAIPKRKPPPPPPARAPAPPPPAPAPATPPPPSPGLYTNVKPLILPKVDDLITYQEVHAISGNPIEISEKVKRWLAIYYPDPAVVIQSASPEKIVGKAIFPIKVEDGVHVYPEKIHYGFEIAFKPGKYRFTLRHFFVENAHLSDPAEKVYTFYLDHYRAHGGLSGENILNHQRFEQLQGHIKAWIYSLKTNISGSNTSDW